MQVDTTRFGTLEVTAEQLLKFPQGMIGYPALQEFFFVPLPDNEAFTWMQSREDPDLAFLLVNPFLFFPEYQAELDDQYCQVLGVSVPGDITLLTVVTIPPEGVRGMTTNLLAPVVLACRQGLGQQIILDGSHYQTRHLLFSCSPQHSAGRQQVGER